MIIFYISYILFTCYMIIFYTSYILFILYDHILYILHIIYTILNIYIELELLIRNYDIT